MNREGKLKATDFASEQEIRWCPSCGDFAILKQIQMAMAKAEKKAENTVFISGIGCSSRFPYYMNTYGFHTIHGRAPSIATGLKLAKPELDIWVITGDGDGLSIGANHLIHAIRRNIDINILLFNNEIYGLTKGQHSPTSNVETKSKTSLALGNERPLGALKLALASDASFIARTIDREARQIQQIMEAAEQHRGTAVVEILQNCNVFNDKAFERFSNKESQKDNAIFLEHGKPMRFGPNRELGIVLNGLELKVANLNEQPGQLSHLLVHDQANLQMAGVLIHQLNGDNHMPLALGLIYQNPEQIEPCNKAISTTKKVDLPKMLEGNFVWTA